MRQHMYVHTKDAIYISLSSDCNSVRKTKLPKIPRFEVCKKSWCIKRIWWPSCKRRRNSWPRAVKGQTRICRFALIVSACPRPQSSSFNLQALEDKANHLNRIKLKLEQNLDELEDNVEREKKVGSKVCSSSTKDKIQAIYAA